MDAWRDLNVLVAEEAVELDDELVLLLREVAALEVGPEVVDPPEAAALAAAEQAGGLGQRAPAPLAVRLDVRHEPVVLLLGPRALVGVRLLAARRPPHGGRRAKTRLTADVACRFPEYPFAAAFFVAVALRQWRLLLRCLRAPRVGGGGPWIL